MPVFVESKILEKLGVPDFPSLKGTDVPLLLKRTDSGSTLDTLIRLFLIDVPCGTAEVVKAFGPQNIEDLIQVGILGNADNEAVAACIKVPAAQGALYIAFDRPSILLTDKKHEYVMGIGLQHTYSR